MDTERLTILKAEAEAQMNEIDKIYAKLDERNREKGRSAVESIGFQLHNLYCAFEDLFRIVAETFENHVHDKSRYHSELLKRMTFRIEGVRPPLLSEHAYALLDNLRAFRHFFRHAYSYELDERKVRIVLDDAYALKKFYTNEINAFIDQIQTT